MIDSNFQAYLTKQYGDIMSTADKLDTSISKVVPTLLSLDISLGGGIPQGSIVLLTGKSKVGKTTLALQVVANAIEKYESPAFYIRVESTRLDHSLLGTIDNLKRQKMQVIPKDNCETTLNAQQYLTIVSEIFKHHKEAIVVIDSIAALSTDLEMSEEVGSNKDMGGVPKLLSQFFRKTVQVIKQNDGILILLSQFQASMSRFGKTFSEKGGNAIQYYNNAWIVGEYKKLWEIDKDAGRPLGHDAHFKIQQAPLGAPYIPCVLPLRFGSGYDVVLDVIQNAIAMGLIEKAGAWFKIDGEKFQGINRLYKHLKDTGKYVKLDQTIREAVFDDNKNVVEQNG